MKNSDSALTGTIARRLDDPGLDTYSIETDRANGCLVIALPSRWNEQILRRYLVDLRSRTASMMQAGGYRGALVDVSAFGIQPKEIADGHAAAMWRAKAMYGVKAALFAVGSRPRLQMMRMAGQTGHRLFDAREDAADWLLA